MENNQNNKKGFFSMSKGLVFILLGVLIIFLALYIWQFHCGLSSDQLRWSQFGDFFNGVISPIFAAINICIFWYLTKVIEDKNEQRQREVQENEDRRQDQNAEHEKALILMQFRKAEIDRFDDIISNAFVPQDAQNNFKNLRAISLALTYLALFKRTKLDIFGLDNNSNTVNSVDELRRYMGEYFKIFKQQQTIRQDVFDGIIRLQGLIISDLQKITLGEKIS